MFCHVDEIVNSAVSVWGQIQAWEPVQASAASGEVPVAARDSVLGYSPKIELRLY
jgi:hypothetical protein